MYGVNLYEPGTRDVQKNIGSIQLLYTDNIYAIEILPRYKKKIVFPDFLHAYSWTVDDESPLYVDEIVHKNRAGVQE